MKVLLYVTAVQRCGVCISDFLLYLFFFVFARLVGNRKCGNKHVKKKHIDNAFNSSYF